MVRRQRRHDRHLRLRRRADPRRAAAAAAPEGDLPVRPARRLRRARRLPRGVPRRRPPPLPLPRRRTSARPTSIAARRETCRRSGRSCGGEAMENPDYRMYPHLYNVLTAEGPARARLLRDADRPVRAGGHGRARARRSSRGSRCRPTPAPAGTATRTRRICRARRPTGATCARRRSCCSPGRRTSSARSTAMHGEILRWYDHWLKGIDTGVMDEPPGPLLADGRERVAHRPRTGRRPSVEWTKLYLDELGAPACRAAVPASVDDLDAARLVRADAAHEREQGRSSCAT